MHIRRIRIAAAIATGVAGLGVLTALAVPNRGEPCARIVAACRAAGFMPGGARSAAGLWADCVRPIMQEMPPRRAALPLPFVGPRVVEACRAMEPDFGRRRRSGYAGVERPRRFGPSRSYPNYDDPDQHGYAPDASAYGARGYDSGRPNFSSPPSAAQPPVSGPAQSDRAAADVPSGETTPATPAGTQRSDNASESTRAVAEDRKKRPNIVFVLTDDLATNLVQFMPHVLQMQKDGLTFRNYFVTDFCAVRLGPRSSPVAILTTPASTATLVLMAATKHSAAGVWSGQRLPSRSQPQAIGRR